MRAGLFLDALAHEHDVSLLVLPVTGLAPAAWPPFVTERTVARACVDLREDPVYISAIDSGQVAALRSYPRPFLCRFSLDVRGPDAPRALAGQSFDIVHVLGLYLAPLAAALTGARPADARTVLDLNDDEVETHRRLGSLYARVGQTALMVVEAAEADKYRALEAEWLPRFDRLLLCSERDRAAVAARTGHPAVHAIANGVRPPGAMEPVAAAPAGHARVLFVGSLDYFPNVDAVTLLCRDVLPRLRTRLSHEILVDVVGRRPPPAVLELGGIPGVTVHADVPAVTPFYARADVAVLPIRAGGGTRLKILEAFAHGVPVVSTAIGAEGLEVEPGRELLIADEPEDLAGACAAVLAQPSLAARLRTEARRLVAARYDAAVVGESIRTLFRELVATRRAPHG